LLYTSLDDLTARREVEKWSGSPSGRGNLIASFRLVEVDNILDLTDPNVRARFGVTYADLTQKTDYNLTQKLGDMARSAGYNGILAPSQPRAGGANLVLFQVPWNE